MIFHRAEIRSIKIGLSLFFLLFGLLFLAKPASAAVRCETQYGGTQVCVTTGQLQVNKEIFDPQNKKYVDNLGINDYKFSPGEQLSFRISVKNVGDATLGNVAVTDIPQAGFFVLATGALNFNLTNLAPGETRQQEIKLKVVEASQLPQNNVICIINAAEATADSSQDRDTVQICLTRKGVAKSVPEAKELPPTGAESWLLAFGSMSGLLVGTKLIRFKRRKFEESYYQITENRFNEKGRG